MKKPNIELINEKLQNVKDEVKHTKESVDDLEQTLKKEYTPLTTTNGIDSRVKKFEGLWEWGVKLILGAIILGILALLGMGAR